MADGDSSQQVPLKILNPNKLSTSIRSYSAALQNKKQDDITQAPTSHPLQIEANLELVPLKPIRQFQGKKAVFFPSVYKSELIEKLQYVLIGKFSHGRPSWAKIKEFFDDLKLSGVYNISVFDQKHMYIECSNKSDYNLIWLRLQWSVDGCAMRILKWEPQFSPVIESPIVPVWIRMEGIPLYMFEEMPLWQIANVIGKPIKIDGRNLKRAMLNEARVCVELDISEPLIDSFWVCFEDKELGVVKDNFCVKVIYDFVPSYCFVCSHVGHRMENCKSKQPCNENDGNQLKAPTHKAAAHKQWIAKPKSAAISKVLNLDKGKGTMYEEAAQKNSEIKGASSSVLNSDIALRIDVAQVTKFGQNVRNDEQDVGKTRGIAEITADSEGPLLGTSWQQQQTQDMESHQHVHTKGKNEEQGHKLQPILNQNRGNDADLEENCEITMIKSDITDPMAVEKLELEDADGNNSASIDGQESRQLELDVQGPQQTEQADFEDEWTTVVRSKNRGKQHRANQIQTGQNEHNMQKVLVKCEQKNPPALEQQVASISVHEFDATAITQQEQLVSNGIGQLVNINRTCAEEVEAAKEDKSAQKTNGKEARLEVTNVAEITKSSKGSMLSEKLNKFRNLKYCDELDKGKRNKLRRSSSVPPNHLVMIKFLDENKDNTDLPIDFDQIFIDQEEKEHSWEDIRSKHLVASYRSVSPPGRSSRQFSSLRKKIELLYYLEGKAGLWDKDSYEETRIKRTNWSSRPDPNTPSNKEKHSQSAPQASRRERGRNRGHHQRKHGKGHS